MPRYLFHAAYDGTKYEGWQSQPHGNTVQDYIEKRIHQLTREQVRIYGSGRTDTGVHARNQPFHLDLSAPVDPDDFAHRLNRMLPQDIAICPAGQVAQKFHARFDANYREYCYRLTTIKDPLNHRYAYYVHHPINGQLIEQGLDLMKGRYDFIHFCIFDEKRESTVCHLEKAEFISTGEHQMEIRFGADRFMRKMVRYLIGSLLYLSRGKMNLAQMQHLLDGTSSGKNPAPTAPAHGLTLEKVTY